LKAVPGSLSGTGPLSVTGMLAKIFVILIPIVTGLDLLKTYGVLARLRRPF